MLSHVPGTKMSKNRLPHICGYPVYQWLFHHIESIIMCTNSKLYLCTFFLPLYLDSCGFLFVCSFLDLKSIISMKECGCSSFAFSLQLCLFLFSSYLPCPCRSVPLLLSCLIRSEPKQDKCLPRVKIEQNFRLNRRRHLAIYLWNLNYN